MTSKADFSLEELKAMPIHPGCDVCERVSMHTQKAEKLILAGEGLVSLGGAELVANAETFAAGNVEAAALAIGLGNRAKVLGGKEVHAASRLRQKFPAPTPAATIA